MSVSVYMWVKGGGGDAVRAIVDIQTAVAAYYISKHLLLFIFELHDYLLPSSTGILTAIQRQTVLTTYL